MDRPSWWRWGDEKELKPGGPAQTLINIRLVRPAQIYVIARVEGAALSWSAEIRIDRVQLDEAAFTPPATIYAQYLIVKAHPNVAGPSKAYAQAILLVDCEEENDGEPS